MTKGINTLNAERMPSTRLSKREDRPDDHGTNSNHSDCINRNRKIFVVWFKMMSLFQGDG